jgi:hypothetical protein
MDAKDFDRRWNELAEEVMIGMAECRLHHPKATLRQTHAPASWAGVETALDERPARTRTCCAVGAGVRARMRQDLALASTAADWD